jgi:hypothetical protein
LDLRRLPPGGSGGPLRRVPLAPGLKNGTVIARPALPGDVNLDGRVNFADLLSLAQHYNAAAAAWTKGNFDYDVEVTFKDLLQLAQSYGRTAAGADGLRARHRRR